MFNAQIKERFIDERYRGLKSQRDAAHVFDATEKWEQEIGADICTFDLEKLQTVVDNISTRKSRSHISRINVLREYFKWANNNHIPGACDSIKGIESVGLDKVKLQMVANPLQLQTFLDKVFDPPTLGTHDSVYRCYLWCAFSGIRIEDLLSITKENIHLRSMSIILNGRKYPIYREAIDAFKVCANNDYFVYIHPMYAEKINKPRFNGTSILRGTKETAGSIDYISTEVTRKIRNAFNDGKVSSRLSYKRLFDSGIFYRKYEQEIAGLPVDFIDEAEFYTEGREYDLISAQCTKKNVIRKIATDYSIDYDRWKAAFYY